LLFAELIERFFFLKKKKEEEDFEPINGEHHDSYESNNLEELTLGKA